MTSLASTIVAEIKPISHSSIPAKVGLALVLAALADWLFYGERIGLSLTLFAIAIAGLVRFLQSCDPGSAARHDRFGRSRRRPRAGH